MKKILVIQSASIGDVILATPVIEALHNAFPAAATDLLVKKGNESLFKGHPFLHDILVWDKRNILSGNYFRLWSRILRTRYDLVVNLQRFFKTGMMTAFSGAGITIGFDKNPVSFLFTRAFPHEIGAIHEVARNNSLIAFLTKTTVSRPRLYPEQSDFEKVASFKKGRYYTISPASLWFTKQFPAIKWIELIRLIPGECSIYLLGSAGDRSLCDEIITKSGHPGAVNLAGELSLLQSAALMQDAKMNFTNDSAPMHLASAVNAPVTAVYCSTLPGFGFGPLSENSTVIEIPEPLSCRPCGLHGLRACPEKHFRCAMGISDKQFAPVL